MTHGTIVEPVYFRMCWLIQGPSLIQEIVDMYGCYNQYALTGIPKLPFCAAGSLMCSGYSIDQEIFIPDNTIWNVILDFKYYPFGINNLRVYNFSDYMEFFKMMSANARKN